jgi:hypothetical protein
MSACSAVVDAVDVLSPLAISAADRDLRDQSQRSEQGCEEAWVIAAVVCLAAAIVAVGYIVAEQPNRGADADVMAEVRCPVRRRTEKRRSTSG